VDRGIKMIWRHTVLPSDPDNIRKLVEKARVFSDEEIQVAGELVQEFLEQGESSGYHFLFLEKEKEIIAYTCYGVIPLTDKRFDLYWIVVAPTYQKQKLGVEILQRTENLVSNLQGVSVYAETSGRLDYLPAQNFYRRNGYEQIAVFKDFYKAGDDKLVFQKKLRKNNGI
jgi:ribosomal protein S18 acetylase RimI-like enzyme